MSEQEFADAYAFDAQAGMSLQIDLSSTAIDSYLIVIGPDGSRQENDDSGGGRNSELAFDVPMSGRFTIYATSYRGGETGAYELKVLPAQRGALGGTTPPNGPTQTIAGALAQGDGTLRTGEFEDIYLFNLTAGNTVRFRLSSTDFDTYLIVIPPTGTQEDNDDLAQGNTNSGLDFDVQTTGPHRVIVTSYRSGMTGNYSLQVDGAAGGVPIGSAGSAPTPTPTPTPGQVGSGSNVIHGDLHQGDTTLPTGEFYDDHHVTLPAGAHLHAQVHSSDFDTYLIVRPPSGSQQDNDDENQGSTDSGLDFTTQVAGDYNLIVTSYRAGMTGAYDLTLTGAGAVPMPGNPTPTPGNPTPTPTPTGGPGDQTIHGTLARGDQTLRTGEFEDTATMRFSPGASIHFRLSSTAFDTYLIVHTPSGRQLDNDDYASGQTNSGIDIPVVEAGDYQIVVTSYRAGMTGDWTLTASQGASVPGAIPSNTAGGGGGGHVFGIFAGISDYPGTVNDLPECANDAVKLSQTLTQAGLIDASHQILLTDSQATVGAIRNAFATLSPQMGPSDTFVFFWSGHGDRRPGSTDPNEIDGVDELVVFYDGEMIDNDMATLYDGIHAGTALLTLDSCFSGGFAKDVITRPGRVGIFSSEEDVTSGVAEQFHAGGYLSYFLRTGMQGDADDDPHDRVLAVGELTHYLYDQFGSHVTDVRMGDTYQQLVIDRGAVTPETVLWAYPRGN